MSEMPQALLNGVQPDDSLALSRGLHYGDGVFRTLFKYDGQIVDFKLQYIKLSHDAQALGLQPPAAELLLEEAISVSASRVNAVIKVLLLRGAAGRGYRAENGRTDRLLLAYSLPDYPAAHWQEGIPAFRCSLRLGSQPALAGIKHLNRLEQVLASRDWPAEAVEGILCDERGNPVCGTRSNLFWMRDGQLFTPALDRCGVAGMMRDKVLACATALGVQVHVEARPWSKFVNAEEIFVTNSLIGIWPVRSLEQRLWQAPGPLTSRLSAVLRHPRVFS
jgi:4-amino-4-deoxychorismate lyase